MKKTLCLLIVTFFISSGNIVFSQVLSGNCPQKEKIREFCKAADTLSRFMDDIKKTSSEDAWAKFVEDAALGPVVAFSHFGKRSTDLQNTFDLLGDGLDANALALIAAIDAEGSLSGQQVRDSIISLINCYYAGNTEIDLTKMIKDGGGPVPDRLDGGPCEIEANSCFSRAAGTHTSQLLTCGFGGAGMIKYFGGWWAAGAGLLCLTIVEGTYNNAKWTCLRNYCECTNCSM